MNLSEEMELESGRQYLAECEEGVDTVHQWLAGMVTVKP